MQLSSIPSPVNGRLTTGSNAKSKPTRVHLMKTTAIRSMQIARTLDQDSTPAHVILDGLETDSRAVMLTSAAVVPAKTGEYAQSRLVIPALHRWAQLAMLAQLPVLQQWWMRALQQLGPTRAPVQVLVPAPGPHVMLAPVLIVWTFAQPL